MASSFPSSLDAFTNPSSTDAMDSVSVPHATQHADLNDAVVALEAKVGADSSAVSSSHDYKIAQLEAAATGKILQVVSTTKTDTFSASISAGSDTAITGLSATITPTSATSKILVMFQAAGARANDLPYFFVRLYRGATEIGSGATASNRTSVIQASGIVAIDTTAIGPVSGHFLDSPATTSATTYALHATNAGTSTHTYYVNRTQDDVDAANFSRTSSSITLLEVSA
jgi:hypothetical protein